MELRAGAFLQGGKYRIEKVLGKGGFGITYLAEQKGLNRKVAVKEFFMSEYCNREEDTSHVSVPSVGSREMVDKYRVKFVKEAQIIAELDHPHIVPIYDVFEENGTAYYVMKYIDGGSLSSLVKKGETMPHDEVLKYVRQVAYALRYCHDRNVAHLDVKPGNILIQDSSAVLIDFGISKHYNEDGDQTSSTPLGISKGYAPLEQYKRGGVSVFSPVTDIYSLGAVLYRLVTGQTPPDADEVNEDGLPTFPSDVPQYIQAAIAAAMQPKKKDRPQSVDDLLAMLVEPVVENLDYDDSEDTKLEVESEDTTLEKSVCSLMDKQIVESEEPKNENPSEPGVNDWTRWIVAGTITAIVVFICILWGTSDSSGKRAVAQLDKDSLTVLVTEDRVSSYKYAIGDYYEDGGVRGIVFSVDSSGVHGVILELYQSPDYFKWCIDETVVGASSKVDGWYNMKKIMTQDDWESRFPAFAYCAAKGPGWYLPAIDELKSIIRNKSLLNKSLQEFGGHPILPNKHNGYEEWGWYWSSTEVNKNHAWRAGWHFNDGIDYGVPDYNKIYDMTVRAVKKF